MSKYKTDSKYSSVVKSLYDGFTKIATKKIDELTSKELISREKASSGGGDTDKTTESSLSINSIANESRGETKVLNTKSKQVKQNNVKNYFKNIESKGRRSNKAFTTTDVFIRNTYLGDKPKIVIEDTPSNKLFKRKNIRKRIKLSKKKVTKPINQK